MSNAYKQYFAALDVLRGPAALLVFAEHWRNLFFVDYSQLISPGLAVKIFYVLTGAGHEAVMVFFVLSGCVIAHVVQTMIFQSRWSWQSYLAARLTRLWVVLLPALLLTAAWDFVGRAVGPSANSIYDGTGFGHVLNIPVAETSGFYNCLGNIFFLQTIYVRPYGSNGPLWSIAYEFVYYLAYPALLITLLPGTTWWYRIISGCFAITLLFLSGTAIIGSFPIWLAGVVAYYAYLKWPVSNLPGLCTFLGGLLLATISVLASRMDSSQSNLPWNHFIAISTAIALYGALSAEVNEQWMRWLTPIRGLSNISFTLYLFHMPILVFIASRFFQNDSKRWQPDLIHLTYATAIGLMVFAYCLLMWYLTEKQTKRLRDWLWRRQNPSQPEAK